MKALIERIWIESAALTVCCAVMLAAFIACALGVMIDPRTITGVPAWLKPAKFAISTAIFFGTIAWLFQYLTVWPRFNNDRVDGCFPSSWFVEVGIIDVQAARGTTSHFNVGTPLDSALFLIMGVAIGVLWALSVGVAYALFRQPFANQTWGWSLRLGMLIFVLGAATGGIMLFTGARTVAGACGSSERRVDRRPHGRGSRRRRRIARCRLEPASRRPAHPSFLWLTRAPDSAVSRLAHFALPRQHASALHRRCRISGVHRNPDVAGPARTVRRRTRCGHSRRVRDLGTGDRRVRRHLVVEGIRTTMTPERSFSAIQPWCSDRLAGLAFAGRTRWASRIATGVVIPLLIAVLYTGLVAAHWGGAQGGFGT